MPNGEATAVVTRDRAEIYEQEDAMAEQYEFISSDTHLEVLPERWTGRVPDRCGNSDQARRPPDKSGKASPAQKASLVKMQFDLSSSFLDYTYYLNDNLFIYLGLDC